MPILEFTKHTPLIFEIKENLVVSKYVDIIKFISILQQESLFFCRVDKLEDRFEGTSPKANEDFFKEFYKSIQNIINTKEKDIDAEVEKQLLWRKEIEEKFKKIACVCCWNKFSDESYAMWKIYSDMNKGIMIKSDIERLKMSFLKTPENIQLSDVRYTNREIMIEPTNLNSPIIHKHIAYSFENEIRLIHQVNHNDFTYNWENEKNQNGENLKVDLNILIDEIILSPYSSDWFLEMVTDLLEKYNLNKKVRFSTLR